MSIISVVHGDSRHVLADLPADSVDAVVTDPPYGLAELSGTKVADTVSRWCVGERDFVPAGAGFVGQAWDSFVPPPALWDEVVRVLKPGGHALVFASPRTQDLMGLSCRLAGFEVRDSIACINAQAMPKGSNLSKHPELADHWSGWGTALKVANDPVLVLRKPLDGTVADNVARFGTGALDVDACRVAALGLGRWPTDVVFVHHLDCRPAGNCHDNCPVRLLDEQSGVLKSGANPTFAGGGKSIAMAGAVQGGPRIRHRGSDSGGASRFFPAFRYAPKAKGAERPDVDGVQHVSVKPLELMRWLTRLVATTDRGDGTPSLVLDPFAGSGTTAEACLLEGFDALVVEAEAAYVPLIHRRLDRHQSHA